MAEPVLNSGRGFAALRQMSSAGMLQRVHVSFIGRNPSQLAIELHQLVQSNPRYSLPTLPRRKQRTRESASFLDPGPENSQLFITERVLPAD